RIRKIPKIVISILVISPLLLSSIMCCCLKEVLANTVGHPASCHGQASKAEPGHRSHKAHECLCFKVQSDEPGNVFAIQSISSHYYEGLLKDGKMLVRYFNDALFNEVSLSIDRPPPFL